MNGICADIFSFEEIEEIHKATVKVLSDPGILVNSQKARDIYREAGCKVDDLTNVVKIPEEILKKALSAAPGEFTLYSRDGKHDVKMVSDGSVVNNMTFGVGTRMIDYEGKGKYCCRQSTEDDLGRIARVVDSCDNIDWICSPVSAMDLATDPVRTLKEVKAVVSNSSKPVLLDPDPSFMQEYFDIETACYGGDAQKARERPFFIVGGCPSSPLQLDDAYCELAISGPGYGMPFMSLSMAMGAASAPIFLAGTMVTHNAEVLAGIVLVELAHPGAEVFYGSSTTSFDFYNNAAPVGSPELALISAAVAQMARRYRIPSIVAGT